MKRIRIREIIQATSGELISGDPESMVEGVSTDSRTSKKDMLFIALKGEKHDGHDFLDQAIEAGCSALIISKESGSINALAKNRGVAIIKVEDTVKALHSLASYYLSLFNIHKVGVTGSTGKTTTKEMLYWILSEKYKTVRSIGNFNNHIGLPLSVFNIEEDTEAVIFEMGMDRPGEIHTLVEIVKPDIGIITNIGLSHIEHMISQENIFKAKMEITDFFKKKDILIVNYDDKLLRDNVCEDRFKIVTVGRDYNNLDFKLADIKDLGENGIEFTLSHKDKKQVFKLSTPGLHNALNASLAIAAGMCLGIDMDKSANGLAKLLITEKRLHIEEKQGIKIVDDTYNASPDSMRAAINVLVSIQGERKIAILGDMFELGDKEKEYHSQIGEYASNKGVDVVISVGKNAKYISEAARTKGTKAIHFDSKELLKGVLAQWIRTGDVVLVKGSRGMAMDEIVTQLKTSNE